ncbi:MAG: prephenate dehydrogenase [Cellulosilyticum sp.]|nr:prephenate dehydrogenase [Cellulosilyticum sp.]
MNIGIIGLGLIGGSIAKSIKQVHVQNSYIIGYDLNKEDLKTAYDEGMIDSIATNLRTSFSNCSVIFLCIPVKHIAGVLEELLPYLPNDCIITDVGSTKYELVKEINRHVEKSPKRVYYVGGHPMTGSERFGYSASSSHLFENAYYMLTPQGDTPEFILFILQKLIERMGGIPLVLSASYHDFVTANISHLPHIVASSLVHLVRNNDGENAYLHALAAGGFKDLTRIASSNPDIWTSICLSNKEQIKKVYASYIEILQHFMDILERGSEKELYSYFDTARIYRNTFTEGVSSELSKRYALHVDAKDEPGIIAKITTLLSENHINIKNLSVISDREFDVGVIKILLSNKADLIAATEILSQNRFTIYY